jgi:hypothetical protein
MCSGCKAPVCVQCVSPPEGSSTQPRCQFCVALEKLQATSFSSLSSFSSDGDGGGGGGDGGGMSEGG